ncbi:MAG TPA: glycosyltransferase family 39 protein [Candidatus Binataceae bacterium]|nr:glycosyltransferase family 39 protein [Candidatus Binataceae bacterium]
MESTGVFAGALAILLTLGASAPFTKELGVCESGAVRDVLAGNIILPHFIPGPMVHVPPLYWWTTAIMVHLFGWTEIAFRLPALAPAAATCAIVYGWATNRLGREAGFWGAASLLFCHFFIDAARQPRMDSMLAMFVTGAIVALEDALASRRRSSWIGATLLIGAGCLTKGILGIALPGGSVALYLLLRKRFFEVFWLDLIATFTIGLAIGLSWYVAGYEIAGHKFLEWQVGMNLWTRFIPASAGGANYCVHPFWYFVPQILVGLLPWSLYFPVVLVLLWRGNQIRLPESIVYAGASFVAMFLFFSLSRGKCQVYILPAFPPLAMLIGWAVSAVCGEESAPPWATRLFSAASIVTAIGATAMALGSIALIHYGLPSNLPFALHSTDQRLIDIFLSLASTRHYGVLNWIVLSILGSLVVLRGTWRFPAMQVVGVLIIALVGTRFWFRVMNPALAEHETLKRFAQEVMDVVPANASIAHLGIEDCGLYFYSPRPIEPISRFSCNAQPPPPPYLLIRKQRFDALPADQRACLTTMLISEPVDGQGPRLLLQLTPPNQ